MAVYWLFPAPEPNRHEWLRFEQQLKIAVVTRGRVEFHVRNFLGGARFRGLSHQTASNSSTLL